MGQRRGPGEKSTCVASSAGEATEQPHSPLTEPSALHLPQPGSGLHRATLCRDASPAKMSSPAAGDLGGGGRPAWRREEGAQHKQPLVRLMGEGGVRGEGGSTYRGGSPVPSSLFWGCNGVVTWREAGGAAHCETLLRIPGTDAPVHSRLCTLALGLHRERKRRPGPAPHDQKSAHSTRLLRDVYTRVHTALFITANRWGRPKCPSTSK